MAPREPLGLRTTAGLHDKSVPVEDRLQRALQALWAHGHAAGAAGQGSAGDDERDAAVGEVLEFLHTLGLLRRPVDEATRAAQRRQAAAARAERVRLILEHRAAGLTFKEIGAAIGMNTSQVHVWFHQEVVRVWHPFNDEARAAFLARHPHVDWWPAPIIIPLMPTLVLVQPVDESDA